MPWMRNADLLWAHGKFLFYYNTLDDMPVFPRAAARGISNLNTTLLLSFFQISFTIYGIIKNG